MVKISLKLCTRRRRRCRRRTMAKWQKAQEEEEEEEERKNAGKMEIIIYNLIREEFTFYVLALAAVPFLSLLK